MGNNSSKKFKCTATAADLQKIKIVVADYKNLVLTTGNDKGAIQQMLRDRNCPDNIHEVAIDSLPTKTAAFVDERVRIKQAYYNSFITINSMFAADVKYVVGYWLHNGIAHEHAWVRDVHGHYDPTQELVLNKDPDFVQDNRHPNGHYPVVELSRRQVSEVIREMKIKVSPDLDHILSWFGKTGEQVPWVCR